MQSKYIDGKISKISITANIISASTSVKFPCQFVVNWKTNDSKSIVQTKPQMRKSTKTDFNQKITLKTQIIFDNEKKKYIKKETQLQLNLLSKSHPQQPKLVGRISIDLASILTDNLYTTLTEFPLQFCSVNASLTAFFIVDEVIETDITVHELQKSFGDSPSFQAGRSNILQSLRDRSKDSYHLELSAEKNNFLPRLQNNTIKIPQSPRFGQKKNQQTEKNYQVPNLKSFEFLTVKEASSIPNTSQVKTMINQNQQLKRSITSRETPKNSGIKQAKLEEVELTKKKSEEHGVTKVYKRIGSFNSQEGTINNNSELSKLRDELNRLKMENDLRRIEEERLKQEYQYTKEALENQQKNNSTKQEFIQKLSNQVSELYKEIAETKTNYINYKEKYEISLQENQRLTEKYNTAYSKLAVTEKGLLELQHTQQISSEISSEFQSLRSRIYSLEENVLELENERLRLNEEIQKYRDKIAEKQAVEEERSKIQSEKSKVEIILEEKNQTIEQLRAQIQKLHAQFKASENEFLNDVTNKQNEKGMLLENIIIMEKKIEQLESNEVAFKQQTTELNKQIEGYIAEINELKEQISNKDIEIQDKKNQILVISNNNAKMQFQLNELHQETITLKSSDEQKIKIYQSLKAEKELLESQKTQLTSQIKKGEQLKEQLMSQISEMQDTMINLGDQIKNTSHELEQLSVEFEEISNQNTNLKNTIVERQTSLQGITQQKQSLSLELSQKLQALLILNEQKGEIQSKLNEKIQIIGQLNNQIGELTSKYSSLQETLLNTNQQSELRRQKIQENVRYISQKSMKIQLLQYNIKNLQQKVQNLSGQKKMLEKIIEERDIYIKKIKQNLNNQIENASCLNIKINQYVQRQSDLNRVISQLAKSVVEFNQIIDRQAAYQQSLKSSIEEKVKDQQKLQDFISDLQEKVRQFQQSLNEQQISYEHSLEQIRSLNEQIQNLQKLIREQRAESGLQTQYMQSEHAEQIFYKEQKIKEMAQEKEKVEVRENELKQKIATIQHELESTQEEILNKNQQISLLKQQNEELQKIVARLQVQLNQNKEKLQEKLGLLSKLQQELAKLKKQGEIKQNEKKQIQIQANEVEQSQLQRIIELQNQVIEHSLMNESLKKEYQTQKDVLNGQLQALNTKIVQNSQALEDKDKKISEIEAKYQSLTNEKSTFDIIKYNQQLKSKIQQITNLNKQLNDVKQQLSKIPTLQRSLKIKTIQLSTIKFKGKGQNTDISQLVKLKDQQISQLKKNNQTIHKHLTTLQSQILTLRQDLQRAQQEMFNVESISNERLLLLEQTKEQNKRIIEEISNLQQRNLQLEKECINNQKNQNPNYTFSEDKIVKQPTARNTKQIQSIIVSLKQTLSKRINDRQYQKLLSIVNQNPTNTENLVKNAKSLSKMLNNVKLDLIKEQKLKNTANFKELITLFSACEDSIEKIVQFSTTV